MRPTILFLTLIAPSKATLSPSTDSIIKHSWGDIPRGWTYHSTPPPDDTFELRIGLKQARIDELIDRLLEISDPNHSSYGKHLSQEESEALASCQPKALDETKEWLAYHGIDDSRVNHHQAGGDWLSLQVSIAEAERILSTQYHLFRHDASGETSLRTLQYSLPHHLHSHIDMVAPTTYFSTLRTMRKTSFLQPDIEPVDEVESLIDPIISSAASVIPLGCSYAITPSCLRALYNTTDYVPTAMSQNRLGVAGYLDQYANDADLQTFLKKFRKDAAGATYPTVQIHGGGNDQSIPGIEANLDIQYTIGMSYPTPNIYYSTGGSPPFIQDSTTTTNTNEPYLDWVTYILNQTTIPQVITTSYGDDEQTVPLEYAVRVCNSFAQIGARGTTLLFSSGDFGVGGGDCKTNDGTNQVLFQPSFPASCPWVTTVGGTTKVNPEVGVNFSGGGFSRYFDQPDYQANAVSGYLGGLGTKYAGKFNPGGRAYPDVSAQANRFQVVVGGHTMSVGGTSASSPTVAGIFALLNDYRLSLGLGPLGFVNPLLYSLGRNGSEFSGFNDIVSGSNPGCGTDGFAAARGWDPITGAGTPSFKRLQALVSK
ncbi:subtilisin-like protein [Coprinellus micaceus]|uniref:tripeptidyl-peptidase II n=1 Tax=Coprinellus micaceus TaxID=71717 RepID=A0A4Y7T6E0_COPMI|nr:subtilisin-like protein [Coprinellus micaceus]